MHIMDCMILGNGPSLKDAILPDLPSFGCNYIGWIHQPTYYACVDVKVLRNPDAITPTARSAKIAFLRDFYSCDPRPRPLYELPNAFMVKRNSFVFLWEKSVTGGTSVYMMLKLAYFAGYDRVYLYGVDHTPSGHFCDDYPDGQVDMPDREYHYKLAALEYARAGRQIINMSPPSILDTILLSTSATH